jgi:uncharacterized protein (TIGR03067 family)
MKRSLMRLLFALSALLVLCQPTTPTVHAQEREREEFQALHGTWKVIRIEEGGKPADIPEGFVYIFSGRKVITKRADGSEEAEVRLGCAAFPKHMDIHWAPDRWDVTIYARCGDYMIQCGNRNVDNHPGEFASGTKEGGAYIIVLRKER